MKRTSFAGAIILIIAIVIIKADSIFKKSVIDHETVRVGFVLPLTGKLGSLGEDIKGALAVLEESESFKDKNIQFIIEDTKADPKTALQAVGKLVSQDKVSIVISGPGSGANMAIAPFLENNKIPFFSISATPNLENAGSYIFRVLPSITEEVEIVANQFKQNGFENVAFMYDSSADSNVIGRDYFEKRFKELGGKEVYIEGYDARTAEDFSSILLKMKSKNPDVYYFLGADQASSVAIRKARQIGITSKFFGWSPTDHEQFAKTAGTSAEDFTLTTFKFSCENDDEEADVFCDAYQKINKRKPAFYAAHTFDLLNIITGLIDQKNSKDESFADYIQKSFVSKEYRGLTGKFKFDENGNVVDKDIVLRSLKNGVFVDN